MIFANFPSFVLSATTSHFAEEKDAIPMLGLAWICIWLKAARLPDDVCPVSSQGLRSPPGLHSEATCNSFYISGNRAPASSRSFSLGEHSNVSPN